MRTRDEQHCVLATMNMVSVPALGTEFHANIELGTAHGLDVGGERIRRVVFRRNANGFIAMFATIARYGCTDPETIEQAKLLAPHAYLKSQPRALRADEYVSTRQSEIRRQSTIR